MAAAQRRLSLSSSLPRLRIVGGRLVDPASKTDRPMDLWIDDGSLVAITPPGERLAGFSPDQEIDATGRVICPGLIDLCARLREPGFEYKATLESEMRAAIAGGDSTGLPTRYRSAFGRAWPRGNAQTSCPQSDSGPRASLGRIDCWT